MVEMDEVLRELTYVKGEEPAGLVRRDEVVAK
jgi:hypothetical protein